MKFTYMAWTALFIGGTSSAHADGRLKATLAQDDSGHPTKLVLTLTNEGDKPLSFERYTTPLQLLDDVHTSFRQFDVVDITGASQKQAEYRGYFVYTVGHPVVNYMTLNPGQSEVAKYDLEPDFVLVPGKTYQVSFRMTLGQVPVDENDLALPTDLRIPARQEIRSNVVIVAPTGPGRADI
jgi:hypothetical protein